MKTKAIFIAFDQAHKEDVIRVLDKHLVRGYTLWENTHGRGSADGEPHYGSHAWPSLNNSILSIVDSSKVQTLKDSLQTLDEESPQLGLRVFVWSIEDMY